MVLNYILVGCPCRRLKTCSWRRKGDNSRAREKRRKPIRSSRLSRSCFTLSRAYESCFACRTLISNWIDRCFGQHLWNSVYSLSRDNPRIPLNKSVVGELTTTTNVRAMNKKQTLLEIYAAIAAMHDSNWSYFSAAPYMRGFFADGTIRCLLYDDFLWPINGTIMSIILLRKRLDEFICLSNLSTLA